MATITVEVTDDDLASLRDMAAAAGPLGSGRDATVEELAANLLAYLADDWRRVNGSGGRRRAREISGPQTS
jgi:hypothetical protein